VVSEEPEEFRHRSAFEIAADDIACRPIEVADSEVDPSGAVLQFPKRALKAVLH